MCGASGRNTKVNFLAGGEIVAVIRSRKVAAKQGFVKYNPYGGAVGTKVSGRNRQGGRPSGVAVRGSTVYISFWIHLTQGVPSIIYFHSMV